MKEATLYKKVQCGLFVLLRLEGDFCSQACGVDVSCWADTGPHGPSTDVRRYFRTESHMMAFAGEQARVTGKVVHMPAYLERFASII
ncbi:hypothetical protein L5D93_26055 [Paenibacillus thiaminolyticus]|nr:hypothetical protein [Paenibacillus thiaminolyticus]